MIRNVQQIGLSHIPKCYGPVFAFWNHEVCCGGDVVSAFCFSRRVAPLAQSKSPPSGSKPRGRTRETFRTGWRKFDGALRLAKCRYNIAATTFRNFKSKNRAFAPAKALFPSYSIIAKAGSRTAYFDSVFIISVVVSIALFNLLSFIAATYFSRFSYTSFTAARSVSLVTSSSLST